MSICLSVNQFVLVRALQRNNQKDIYGYIRDLLWEITLAHVIMEVEVYWNMLPARWRTRKAGGIIQSSSKALRTGNRGGGVRGQAAGRTGTMCWHMSWNLKAWGIGAHMSKSRRGWHSSSRREFNFPLPFYSSQALKGPDNACPCWWGKIFFT